MHIAIKTVESLIFVPQAQLFPNEFLPGVREVKYYLTWSKIYMPMNFSQVLIRG